MGAILARSPDGRLRNDARQPLVFQVLPSVPSFELWLLHFEDIQALLHRNEVLRRLKQHLAAYEKGADKAFASTSAHLAVATRRAQRLAARFTADTGTEPFAGIAGLVTLLISLRR